MAKPTTFRQAPRQRSRRGQKDDSSAPDPSTLRRSGRQHIEKAYSNTQAPVSVQPAESLQTRKRHPVPYLEGQEDIVRSDGEEPSTGPCITGAPVVPLEPVPSDAGSPMTNGVTTQPNKPLLTNTPVNQEPFVQDLPSEPTEVPTQSSESTIGIRAEHNLEPAETPISNPMPTLDLDSFAPSSLAPALPTPVLAAQPSQFQHQQKISKLI